MEQPSSKLESPRTICHLHSFLTTSTKAKSSQFCPPSSAFRTGPDTAPTGWHVHQKYYIRLRTQIEANQSFRGTLPKICIWNETSNHNLHPSTSIYSTPKPLPRLHLALPSQLMRRSSSPGETGAKKPTIDNPHQINHNSLFLGMSQNIMCDNSPPPSIAISPYIYIHMCIYIYVYTYTISNNHTPF